MRASRLALSAMVLVLVGGCATGPGAGSAQPASDSTQPAPSPSSPLASADIEAIRAQIESRYLDQLLAIGYGAYGTIHLALKPTATAAAAEIAARYGSIVEITVGFFPYPPPPSPRAACEGLRPATVDPGSLRAEIVLSGTRLAHGFFYGSVRLVNTGKQATQVMSGQPVSIYLFDAADEQLVGASPGAVAGTGLELTLAPGASRLIDAAGGTGSCDLARGYELPDGAYVARAAVEVDGATGPAYIWSEPLSVLVGQ